MPRYRVVMTTWANTTVEVEAESAEQAVAQSLDTPSDASLCWSCNDNIELGDEWTPYDSDYKPYGVTEVGP